MDKNPNLYSNDSYNTNKLNKKKRSYDNDKCSHCSATISFYSLPGDRYHSEFVNLLFCEEDCVYWYGIDYGMEKESWQRKFFRVPNRIKQMERTCDYCIKSFDASHCRDMSIVVRRVFSCLSLAEPCSMYFHDFTCMIAYLRSQEICESALLKIDQEYQNYQPLSQYLDEYNSQKTEDCPCFYQ